MTTLTPDALGKDDLDAIKARHADEWKHAISDNSHNNWISEQFAAQMYCDVAALLRHVTASQARERELVEALRMFMDATQAVGIRDGNASEHNAAEAFARPILTRIEAARKGEQL